VFRRPATLLLLLGFVAVFAANCGQDSPAPPKDYQALIDAFQLAPLPNIPYPPYNTYQAERIELGRLLFFDPILGGESAPWVKSAHGFDPYRYRPNDMACGTCHVPRFGFADGRRAGAGVGGGGMNGVRLGQDRDVPAPSLITGSEIGLEPRNTPTVLNTAMNGRNSIDPVTESFQFMDGRVTLGLEVQALEPITDRQEMAGDAFRDSVGAMLPPEAIRDSLTLRIRNIPEYVDRFERAFPGLINKPSDITMDHISKAIAAFERQLVTPGSRYDRFVSGETNAFTPLEREGFELFFGKAQCGSCHAGPMLSDYSFHVQGAGDDYASIAPNFPGKDGAGHDYGRFHADPIEFANQKYAFRTLTIRNVEITAPYFHSGSATSLSDVVEFYNRGGRGPEDISDALLATQGAVRDTLIRPLGLSTREMGALVAFMKTTTAPVPPGPGGLDLTTVPERVPSGLLPPGIATPAGPGPFTEASSRVP
jgi:cytochrome c peroxidase